MSMIDELVKFDLWEVKRDVDRLREIEKWAIASLGLDYKPGDRVEIIHPRPSQSTHGWFAYREALAVGQTGIAGEISFNQYSHGGRGAWHVLVGLDRCWSVDKRGDGQIVRYWRGPAAEVPEGFTVVPYYPPEGKIKWFSLAVSWVQKAD
jgi:hypothetical protein